MKVLTGSIAKDLRELLKLKAKQLDVADRDVTEGNTDIPKEATLWTMETLEPHELYRLSDNYSQ